MRFEFFSFFLPLVVSASVATAADAPTAVYVSDHPELILTSSQSWGKLGLNTAAHLAGQPAMPLQIGEKQYAKGLGSHANGEITLELFRQFTRLDAEIGVQKQPGDCGSVIFMVRGDGKELFRSHKITGKMPAQAISIPVQDVEELQLKVNAAADGFTCDLANWAHARLTPASHTDQVGGPKVLVDMAPFARVATWDPKRMDGTRASRIQEFHAEDLFTETELKPNRDGTYKVPTWENGVGCIGLQWLNRRALRELTLEFTDASQVPSPSSVRVEGWHGESAWQGNWRALTNEFRQEGPRLICKLNRTVGVVLTRKIRWILPVSSKPQSVRLSAFTRSHWSTTNLWAQFDKTKAGGRGEVIIWNGELANKSDRKNAESSVSWRLSQPLQLSVRYSLPSPFKSDPTLLQFHLPTGDVSVAVADVLANDCVYLPDLGLFLAREPLPVTLADYQQRIAGKKTVLEEVREMPDQTLAQAMEKTHHDAQKEGPVLLSLACDNTKFMVERDGALTTYFYPNPAVAKSVEKRLMLKPTFGDGKNLNLTRTLDGGWLPIPAIEVEDRGVKYRQRTFVAPADEPGNNPTRLNRSSVCVVELTATNTLASPAEATMTLAFQLPSNAPVTLESRSRGWRLEGPDEKLGFVATSNAAPLTATVEKGMLKLAGQMPAHGIARCVVFLPTGEGTSLASFTADNLRAATKAYWNDMLASATQVETPDPLLNDVIRSSQVRCLIDARSEADGARVAAWIAAVSYGPLESESHSPIRGMDLMGHNDFARRALDFFIHRYNKDGFLTTGYTTFGTAWHLWTVGEHYRLTRDKVWLKQVAPEIARVCHWIVRQTEKTKRLDAYGQRVPEYGLMPPGVLADWNAFAYHFCMNAYYVAALREVGTALKDIGYPDAQFFINQSEELRKNTLRAYAWTQSRAPALPLRDGTWVPDYPSQVHSPGNLADFFPGQDAGRSWCYNVELGAHQLVPAGVLAPQSRGVTQMMDHMEDVQFLADGWFDYPSAMNHADWYDNGGFSKVQPYYTRNAEIYAMRDDVKPFVRSYFNTLAAMLNPEVLTIWEHFHHSGAWDKTHETGYFLQQTRFMLATEHGKELWLAPLITSNWLKDGQTVSAINVPTTFGEVSFRINSHVKNGYIEARVEPPTRSTPKALVLRLRHPDGKPIRSVTVNGKPYSKFDPESETITLPRGSKPLDVRAEF